MADFSATRSEYLRVMMGERDNALAPYRPEQMNDLGDTSFDVAALSDDDINLAINQMTGTKYEGTDIFRSLQTEQSSRKEKAQSQSAEKPWWENITDFFSNIGTAITEGVFKFADTMFDYGMWFYGGLLGGGWFGAKNDFTDWVANVMTDDRWVDYATKGATLLDVFNKDAYYNGNNYWSDWSYENLQAQKEQNWEGLGGKDGVFKNILTGVGEMLPSMVLAFFSGGASVAATAAIQGSLGFARSAGGSTSQAMKEGASFQQASAYGAIEGGINGAIAAISASVGGTLAKEGGSGIIKTIGQNFGKAVGSKFTSGTVQVVADKAMQIGLRVLGSAGTAAVRTAFEPALQMIYDENAWYNAYGTEENRQRYGAIIAKSALTAAAGSAIVNTGREFFSVAKAGSFEQYKENYFTDLANSEVMSKMTRAQRRDFVRSQREYLDNQKQVAEIQKQVDQMRANGKTDAEIQSFAISKMQELAPKIEAWTDKYQDFYSKLSYQYGSALSKAQSGMTDAKLNSAAMKGANRFAGMLRDLNTGDSLKANLIKLGSSIASRGTGDFDFSQSPDGSGQTQVGTALITYKADSDSIFYQDRNSPLQTQVEARVVGGVATLTPRNAEQMEVIASLVKDPAAAKTLPSSLLLPLRTGELNVNIGTLNVEQITKLVSLNYSDFKTLENGSYVAELGGGKSLVLASDLKSGEIVKTARAEAIAEPASVKTVEEVPTPMEVESVVETPATAEPLNLEAEPSVVKQAAQAKVGDVYSLSDSNSMVKGVLGTVQDLLSLDNIGGVTKLKIKQGATAKEVFDTLNLGTEEQRNALKDNLKNKLLDMNILYEYKDYYGEDVLPSYSGTLREFLSTLDEAEVNKFNADFDEFYNKLLASGSESEMSKVIRYFTDKITAQAEKFREFKVQTKITRHIEKHKTKLLRRYYHNDGKDFGPDFNFDTQGYKVLLEPLHGLKQTANGQSYSGSSAVEAFKKFVDIYKLDNFAKKNDAGEIVSTSSLYNQGLRDLAILLIDSIEAHSHVDKNGKVIYSALSSEELSILRKFQDAVEEMPKLITKDTLAAVSDAKAAYHGVERYVSSIVKNDKVGMVRNFIQGYAERYANQLDTLMFEIGDNELSRAIYNELYLSQAQAQGMRDDFQGKINAVREKWGITNKKLNALSSTFKDTSGKPIEMKYLVRIYQHMLAGEESNNVKYINANSVYIRDSKGKLIHVAKFSYSDMDAIATELKNSGLYAYMTDLHRIESGDLGDIYDQDYVRDTHIQNSNRMKEYTAIKLESNRTEMGKAYVKSGTAKYGHQKDRVDKIPSGVHLVVNDAESALMSQVANQANIHFNDPVLKKINGMLSTRINDKGTTVKEYLAEHNPGALKLIERAIWGAYGINPNKAQHIIDFIGNGYVMSLIGMNPGSILRQPLSIMWSNDISMASVLRFTIGANLNPYIWRNSTRLINEIEKEFPELKLRGKKNEALMGNAAADAIGKVQNAIGKVAGFGLKMTDAWTVGHEAVGLLAMQAQKLGYGEIGTPENDEYVKYHYRAFYATQVSSNRMTMSGARAGYYGGIGKLTSFMTGAVQGQIGYLLRAAQQIQEFGGKTQEYYDGRIETTKQAEEDAKNDYEDAVRFLDETEEAYERGEAESEDVKSARESAKEAFDKYTSATGERADAETSAKGFRHFKDMGGAKGVVAARLASMLVTGLALVLISELTARLKGQKAWNEFDMSSAGIDLAINSTVGWMPVARDLINAWKGYDLDIPEYAMVRQAYDFISAIAKVAQDPSDKSARALLRQTIETVSAFLGIPATNLWKYANGIIKTFSPAAALRMNNLLYGASPTSLASTAKEYAEKNDISTASDLYQSLYAIAKTGDISREVAVEEAKLVQEGFNPVARNVPDYIQNDDGERVILSDSQKTDFSKIYSKANKIVVRLIKSTRYKNMDSATKAKSIKKVYDLYYDAARYRSLGIEPSSKLGKLLAFASDYDADILATLMLIQQNSELADNRRFTKKEQALKIVNQQAMTKDQKLLTLYLMGYGVSSENKKRVRNYLVGLGFTKKQAEEFLPS